MPGAGKSPRGHRLALELQPGWREILRYTVAGGAVQGVTFNVSGESYRELKLVWALIRAAGGNASLSWRPNGSAPAGGNQNSVLWYNDGVAPTALTSATLGMGNCYASGYSHGWLMLRPNTGANRSHSARQVATDATAVTIVDWIGAGEWIDTSTVLSSIQFLSSVAASIGNGSEFALMGIPV